MRPSSGYLILVLWCNMECSFGCGTAVLANPFIYCHLRPVDVIEGSQQVMDLNSANVLSMTLYLQGESHVLRMVHLEIICLVNASMFGNVQPSITYGLMAQSTDPFFILVTASIVEKAGELPCTLKDLQ